MSSGAPEQTSEKPGSIDHVNTRQKLPTPKAIEAESRSRNSYERLRIVRLLAIALTIALGLEVIAYFVVHVFTPTDAAKSYNDHVKDILIVLSSLVAYLLGYGSGEKKEEK